jgi:g-D-glutamyl-meso-diaminopimelate peptidase
MDIYREISRFFGGVKTEKRIIGNSVQRRNLYAIRLGEGNPVGIAVYGIHGREWLTARLAKAHYADGLRQGVAGTIWLIPLANPDGALLSQKGLSAAKGCPYFRFLSAYSNGELRQWKANARGVDLNVNFAAEWGKGVRNVRRRGAENYIGEKPFSEPETLALKRFTEEIKPDYTVSFHTKGEEIYWYFGQGALETARDYRIGQALSMATGYPLRLARGSVGGYKDWCISALKIPSYTVEVGADNFAHPLRGAAFMDVYQHCGGALFALSTAVRNEKINERRKIYVSSNSGGEAWLETGGSAYRGGDCLRG